MLKRPYGGKIAFDKRGQRVLPEHVPQERQEGVRDALAAANRDERQVIRGYFRGALIIELDQVRRFPWGGGHQGLAHYVVLGGRTDNTLG